ncbi:hypothetical protein EON63_23580 [archaeon]|nr:MAG: hypothetical protein EON63_23580 [archaeon]
MNYETVKYFTNEGYEIHKYRGLIGKYQKALSSTKFFLSLLNISQQVHVNLCVCVHICLSMCMVWSPVLHPPRLSSPLLSGDFKSHTTSLHASGGVGCVQREDEHRGLGSGAVLDHQHFLSSQLPRYGVLRNMMYGVWHIVYGE